MNSIAVTGPSAADRSQRVVALAAGLGLLLMAILAPLAHFGVLGSLIVPADPAATVSNLTESNGLLRVAVAALLFVTFLDLLVAWALYLMLRPVNPALAMLVGWLRLAAAAAFLPALANLLDVAQLLGGPDRPTIPADLLTTTVVTSIASFNNGWDVMLAVFGLHLVGVGYLVFRSVQFPRVLGLLVVVAGVGYLADTFTRILVPDFTFTFSLFTFVGEALLIVAFLWRAAKGFVPEPGDHDDVHGSVAQPSPVAT